MQYKRPVNIYVFSYKYPITALASIGHRISGLILFLYIPVLLGSLQYSLTSKSRFVTLQQWLLMPLAKTAVWIFLVALIYHLLAGIRHIAMDMGYGESLQGGKLGAKIVIVLAIISSLLIGIWLW